MIDRRHFLSLAAASAAGAVARSSQAASMSRVTAYAFTFPGLDGGEILLSSYAGHPMLVVNTASLCGYTPQYAGLQTLWTRFRDKGLFVLGVPSNDFGNQEPGGADDIGKTAHEEYHVTFPLTTKVAVKGPDAHPFYKWAALERPLEAPRWNFHKYLMAGSAPALPRPWDRPIRLLSRRSNGRSQPTDRRTVASTRLCWSCVHCDPKVTGGTDRHKTDKFRLTTRRSSGGLRIEIRSRGPAACDGPTRTEVPPAWR